MKVFVKGSCKAENIYSLVDPTAFSEAEFEGHVLAALQCVYPDYYCIPFRGGFEFDSEIHEADLALVHREFSHWFIVEVELASHSLHGHVVPQVRCFQYGRPQLTCVDYLCRHVPQMTPERAETLIRHVPRAVAVVANRKKQDWEGVLRGVETQIVTLSVFETVNGEIAHELEGSLYVPKTSLGFFTYSAPDRSIRMTPSCGLPQGVIQMEDPYGIVGLWTVRPAGDSIWVTKNSGDPDLPHNGTLQVLRTHTGKLTLRIPGTGTR